MTLEEAKRKIKELYDKKMDDFCDSANPFRYSDAMTYSKVLQVLDEIDTEPELSRNPGRLTLKELVRELRKIFKFKYLTAERPIHSLYFALWNQKPVWNGESWRPADNSDRHIVADFFEFEIVGNLDLSEYRDTDGVIDYSRCIVEVADDID